jgi:glycerol kinase
MTAAGGVLALDQGTTSTRAILFDAAGKPLAEARRELPLSHPRPGWVEHDPERIWSDAAAVCREAVARAGVDARTVAAIGIANQRETVVVWERDSGQAIHPAIVWQDRRTAEVCARLRAEGAERIVQERTGLVVDPYFSATKIAWILDHLPGARARAEAGELCAGTIDCFLLWRLSGGTVHATDATNASRTALYDLRRQTWSDELCALFRVPRALLPRVVDCSGALAMTSVLGPATVVAGCAGDQQAAAIGQACTVPGMAKTTLGTGAFLIAHTGDGIVASRHRLLATVAWRLAGRQAYAVEGSIFNAGATIGWLCKIGVLREPAESARLAASLTGNAGVYLVPAFTGLGAPHWDADARAAITGIGRETGAAEIARAALEAVAYQVRDLADALAADGIALQAMRVDGGMSANDWLMQAIADQCGVPVARPAHAEGTALGAALLAGMHAGVYPGVAEQAPRWRAGATFAPKMDAARRERDHVGWRRALATVVTGRA